MAANHASRPVIRADDDTDQPIDESLEPGRLAGWSEFHRRAEELPEEERAVFDLLWYQGLSQTEAAMLLDLSARTVRRRWHAACLKLHDVLPGDKALLKRPSKDSCRLVRQVKQFGS